MSWAIVKNNQVIEVLNGAKAVTINGIQYPSSIFGGSWSKDELKNIGIYPTQITSTIDNKTHVGTGGVTYTINTDHVAVHYGKKTHDLTVFLQLFRVFFTFFTVFLGGKSVKTVRKG